jgi:hypothetical protein
MRTFLMVPVLALGVATVAGYALARDEQIRVDVLRRRPPRAVLDTPSSVGPYGEPLRWSLVAAS